MHRYRQNPHAYKIKAYISLVFTEKNKGFCPIKFMSLKKEIDDKSVKVWTEKKTWRGNMCRGAGGRGSARIKDGEERLFTVPSSMTIHKRKGGQ